MHLVVAGADPGMVSMSRNPTRYPAMTIRLCVGRIAGL